MVDIVIIGGCGHVGLPLGLAFARAGKSVVALDISEEKVNRTNEGKMPFSDAGADELLPVVLADGSFRCTTDPQVISDAEVVVTVIGTPLDEHLTPRFEVYQNLIEQDQSYLRPGQLLILRSTVYPGTTERIARALRKDNREVDVAFCPERVAEGVALEEITALPQLVAGCDERAQSRAEELFRTLTPDVIALEPLAAELAKLYNNTWRYIQFAVANQMFMIANDCGVDFYEVHRAMTHKYPRGKDFPKAGFAAGPCLFKDTMQLSCFNNNALFLGHAAMLINEGLPNYLVRKVEKLYDLPQQTVGILGMTFKADSDDIRDSLSLKLLSTLQIDAGEVLCSDPHLDEDWLTPLEETVERSDLLFIGVPHQIYRTYDFGDKPVIDIWNATRTGKTVI